MTGAHILKNQSGYCVETSRKGNKRWQWLGLGDSSGGGWCFPGDSVVKSLPAMHPLSWWCHPTISSPVMPFSSSPQSFQASGSSPMSQLFPSGGQSIKSFYFNISLSNEHPGLISFRMDWLDLLAVQGTLKSLLQHHSSKASILQPSAFYILVQLSHP